MAEEKNVKKLHSEEGKEPYNNRTTTLYKNWVKNGQIEEKKHTNAKEP